MCLSRFRCSNRKGDPVTTKEVLTQARALIANEKDWCQGTAENMSGQRCAIGAIRVATTGSAGVQNQDTVRAREWLREVIGQSISGYNDSRSHECVISAFDLAIEKCET